MDDAERARWVTTWRRRAAVLDAAARGFRGDGDPEYAAELEQAAADNRTAADLLGAGASVASAVLLERSPQWAS